MPVDPALTKPPAWPALTSPMPTAMLLLRFLRSASVGVSVDVSTSGASTIWTASGRPAAATASATWDFGPVKTTSSGATKPLSSASATPATVSRGAWSPPTASKTILLMRSPLGAAPATVA